MTKSEARKVSIKCEGPWSNGTVTTESGEQLWATGATIRLQAGHRAVAEVDVVVHHVDIEKVDANLFTNIDGGRYLLVYLGPAPSKGSVKQQKPSIYNVDAAGDLGTH